MLEVEYKNIDFLQTLKDHIYVKNEPLLIKGVCSTINAVKKWSPEYISSLSPSLPIIVKQYGVSNKIVTKELSLSSYVDYLIKSRSNIKLKEKELLYCHDIPMFNMINALVSDINPTFLDVLPSWYHDGWWKFFQFFMGPSGSWTPLHFDCLLTHNLFFQIAGQKRFSIIHPKFSSICQKYDWRWFKFNPESDEYNKFPKLKNINIDKVIISPGDILYMPPGTLHSVKGLSESISFNIDFHTSKSVINAIFNLFKGMPRINVYYNTICALGIILKIPQKYLFKFYKPYLNYIS
ncbi:MAG: cupin-like domain-containing protein [Arcobacter sp.]|nr:cupin-like domain-containing protein [Arcobacter sp.]